MNENVKEYLPLTEATYYILISLIKPLHGYGIMQNVEDISKGEVTLGPGTLYGALNKLEKKGLIMKAENTEDSRRKNYVITEFGKLVIIEEYKRLNELIKCSKNIIKSIGG
ncbi:MAG: PadR family transcriptional regulator [Firmicutes bacterium]|nr:PadR family transcriptional regulator [Bacillota bacterium]